MTNSYQKEEAIVIGGGPCGLAAAIALQEKNMKPLVIEKGNIVQAIYQFPTHQTFFSTPEKLEIGNVPFIIEERKPKRNQALSYYREVVRQHQLRIHTYEEVYQVTKEDNDSFTIQTKNRGGQQSTYSAPHVIIATGYYENPNYMNIPGEDSHKVFHYFKEAHPFFDQHVAIIGGKNSAIDAALELEKVGAHVTVLYRGDHYPPAIKPWILPEFESLVRHGKVNMIFEAEVKEIKETEVFYEVGGTTYTIKNDFVFAMTGYQPDHQFLTNIGVDIEPATGRPVHDPQTMETNVDNLFISGVIAAGNDANEIFIENGRFHGKNIAEEIIRRRRKS